MIHPVRIGLSTAYFSMPSLTSLLRDTLLTLRYVPPSQLQALIYHRFASLRCRWTGNPWPSRIQRLLEKEMSETHPRNLGLPTVALSQPYERLLSSWRQFRSGKLLLVNREETFTPGQLWGHFENTNLPPLVVETFHYHQFIVGFGELLVCPEVDEKLRLEILESMTRFLNEWWERYPVGKPPAWGAFATAFRIRSWLLLHRLLSRCPESLAGSLKENLAKRAFIHGLYLERNLEYYLGGNHLFKDLCALAMLASFFEGPAADRWWTRIARELPFQIKVQILPDGGHYERSPMYQCLVLSDIRDAAEYLQAWNPSWVTENLLDPMERMARFLKGILHPDGEIPLFNDSVLGQAPVVGGGEIPMPPLSTFPDTGITRIHQGDMTCIIDHGPLGPDELMGHVHNDTLSFELSVGNERFIVDKGVYEYTAGGRRTECRSIRSHNTPSIDGFEQAETWASFRVARRWHINSAEVLENSSGISVRGRWERPGMGSVGRQFSMVPNGILIIRDEIQCPKPHTCEIPLLFATGVEVTIHPDHRNTQWWRWEAKSGVHALYGWIHSASPLQVMLEDTVYWPRFYTELPSVRIVTRAKVEKQIIVFTYLGSSWEVLEGLPSQNEIYSHQGNQA